MLSWKDKKLNKIDTKQIIKNWTTYFVLFLALGAMAFFGVCDPGQQGNFQANLTDDAAKVNGYRIKNTDFRRAYQNAYSEYQRRYKDGFDPAAMQLSRMVLTNLVNEYLMFDLASRGGFSTSISEIDKFLREIDLFKDEKGAFSSERFDNFMRSNGYTEASFIETVQRQLTINKMRTAIMDSTYISEDAVRTSYQLKETKLNVKFIKLDKESIPVNITDADVTQFLAGAGKETVKKYYEENKNEFSSEKKVKARHILVAFKEARNASGSAAQRTKEDARKRAEEAHMAATKNSSEFGKLAQKYSDDTSTKDKGGDLGFFAKDAMVPEFSNVAFNSPEGKVSNIVESPFGFHTIIVDKIDNAKSLTLEDTTKSIAHKLLAKERRPKIADELGAQLLTALKANNASEVSKLMAQGGLKWEESGEFGLTSRAIPKVGADNSAKDIIFALKSPGEYSPTLTDLNGSKFIFQLVARKEANIAQLTAKEIDELRNTEKMTSSYAALTDIVTSAEKKYREDKKIWENPEYLNLDLNRSKEPKE